MAVYEVQERLEADVSLVLGVAEAEGRGVGVEYTRCRTSGERAPQDAGRKRPGPAHERENKLRRLAFEKADQKRAQREAIPA